MNILVTGSCGYIGKVTIAQLSKFEKIDKIIGIDVVAATQELLKIKNYQHFKCDIRDQEIGKLMHEHNIDTVVHLASILNPPPGMTEDEVESIEIDGTQNILNAAAKSHVKKLIFTSSGAAYGYYADNPNMIKETHQTRGTPHFPYSKHKAHIERILSDYSKQHPQIKTLILRPGTILGENTKGPITDYFQKNILVGIKGYKSPFCFIYDKDVCAAILQGCLKPEITGVYNLSGDGIMTLKEIAEGLETKYLELPRGLMKFAIRILKTVRLTQYSPYQVDFMCFRPVLDNEKLKNHFVDLPSKTTREVFDIYNTSRNLS